MSGKKPRLPGEIELRSPAELKPYEKNAREHPPEQIAQLVESIREWGFTMPLLVSEENGVIAGHGRLEAAKLLGMPEVPVLVARGWSEEQRRAYVLADNQLALTSEWNTALLRSEIFELSEMGVDLKLSGFSPQNIRRWVRLEEIHVRGRDADELAPDVPEKPITQPGDLWILGDHRLICGSATDPEAVAKLLGDDRPHLMVTDPPYGVNYDPAWRARAAPNLNRKKLGKVQNDDRADWTEAWDLFPGDVAYVWHADRHSGEVPTSLERSGFALRAQIIWVKDRPILSRGDYHWKHEPCCYAVRKKATGHWQGARDQNTVWEFPVREDGGHGHGTQKPIAAMQRPMENNSEAGDGVYDPFVGSGTTIIAAEVSARKCYAIDLDPGYCDVAVERWEQFSGKKAKKSTP